MPSYEDWEERKRRELRAKQNGNGDLPATTGDYAGMCLIIILCFAAFITVALLVLWVLARYGYLL